MDGNNGATERVLSLLHILSYCDAGSVLQFSATCQVYHALAVDRVLWGTLAERDYACPVSEFVRLIKESEAAAKVKTALQEQAALLTVAVNAFSKNVRDVVADSFKDDELVGALGAVAALQTKVLEVTVEDLLVRKLRLPLALDRSKAPMVTGRPQAFSLALIAGPDLYRDIRAAYTCDYVLKGKRCGRPVAQPLPWAEILERSRPDVPR